MPIPIMFCHFGDSFYLDYTFKCARYFNPNTEIILLGDETNKHFSDEYNLNFEYSYKLGNCDKKIASKFNFLHNNYVHIGTAPAYAIPKHKFNFLRWFSIYDYMVRENINELWYFDSDTIICRNLSEIEENYNDYSYYVSNGISGCGTLIRDKDILYVLCHLIFKYKSDLEFTKEQVTIANNKHAIGKHYNFCDMTVIRELSKGTKLGELTKVINDSIFDWNINSEVPDQVAGRTGQYLMDGKKKAITWENRIPYFYSKYLKKLIRANVLNLSWSVKDFYDEIINNLIGG
jgi:hypothetical protein